MIDMVFREAELSYASVSPDIIIRVIAKVLDRLIDINEQTRCQTVEVITKFHSLYAPDVSLENYLQRIKKYANCSISCFVIALIYIDRLIAKQGFSINRLNVHRLLITSVMIAIKFHEDDYYKNTFYAKLGGLSLEPTPSSPHGYGHGHGHGKNGSGGSEINVLERELLSYLEFHCMVDTVVYNRYMRELTNWNIVNSTANSGSMTNSPIMGPYVSNTLCQTNYPSPNIMINPYPCAYHYSQMPCYPKVTPSSTPIMENAAIYPHPYYPNHQQPMANIWQNHSIDTGVANNNPNFSRIIGPNSVCSSSVFSTAPSCSYPMSEISNSFHVPQRDPSPRGVDQLLWAENYVNYPLTITSSSKSLPSNHSSVQSNYVNYLNLKNPYGAVGQGYGHAVGHGQKTLRSVYL